MWRSLGRLVGAIVIGGLIVSAIVWIAWPIVHAVVDAIVACISALFTCALYVIGFLVVVALFGKRR